MNVPEYVPDQIYPEQLKDAVKLLEISPKSDMSIAVASLRQILNTFQKEAQSNARAFTHGVRGAKEKDWIDESVMEWVEKYGKFKNTDKVAPVIENAEKIMLGQLKLLKTYESIINAHRKFLDFVIYKQHEGSGGEKILRLEKDIEELQGMVNKKIAEKAVEKPMPTEFFKEIDPPEKEEEPQEEPEEKEPEIGLPKISTYGGLPLPKGENPVFDVFRENKKKAFTAPEMIKIMREKGNKKTDAWIKTKMADLYRGKKLIKKIALGTYIWSGKYDLD